MSYLKIPVTDEQEQLIPLGGVLLVEQTSTTKVTVYYKEGSAVEITHAVAGAGDETQRDYFQRKLEGSIKQGSVKLLNELPYAVSAVNASFNAFAASDPSVEVITASKTVSDSDHGKTIGVGTDALVITLDEVTTLREGFQVTIVNTGADGNNIITVSPNANDAIFGTIANSAGDSVSSGALDKDWVNTLVTANNGDYVKLKVLDANGFYIVGGVGIWASEA